jgi:winged helix domain-containing protein/ATPase family protein associated with various cellular activities (AAA)
VTARAAPAQRGTRLSAEPDRTASLAHLRGRCAAVEERVRAAVERRRAADEDPDDAFRGLYISEEHVDRLLGEAQHAGNPVGAELLARVEAGADAAVAAGEELRLRRLAEAFGLEPVDTELLLVALMPDLDPRFELLYAYLHDDITQRRASIGLALELSAPRLAPADARHRLTGTGPLVVEGLIEVEDSERPFLTRTLRVPDRVLLHLLGDDHTDPALGMFIAEPRPCRTGDPAALARAIVEGATLIHVREPGGGAGHSVAAAALARAGLPVLALDLSPLSPGDDAGALVRVALREARLRSAGLIAGPVDRLAELDRGALRTLADSRWAMLLTGESPWDPSWARSVPLNVELSPPASAERAAMWHDVVGDDIDGLEASRATTQFRMGPEAVARAAEAAQLSAVLAGRDVSVTDLRAGALAQNASGLERLARRIHPRVRWDDLVLPPATIEHLREIADRAAHRDLVHDEWRMGGGKGSHGVTALFVGESGTGKTMGAEVLAHELGLDLYAVDLATVVDKYVGETEKNLDRVFEAAGHVNCVLFFDEADALFGKRSDVKDAHDRYANIETAYLLQRMETFEGIAILATNLGANIDDAFARRLDAMVDFPLPEEEHRRELWERCLGTRVPRAGDLDLDFLARAFELSGGNIRNVTLAAAFRAAAEGRPISMADLIRGTGREYRKLGRLVTESEFGPHTHLIAPEGAR